MPGVFNMPDIDYRIYNDYIHFTKYPFKCSSAYKNGIINASDIAEAVDSFFPPVIRTISNELIMIPYLEEKSDTNPFLLFCTRNNIAVNKRPDIWEMILDPFLDTEHSNEYIEANYDTLDKYGVTHIECAEIRREVNARMFAYNFESCLWEWFHLGLYDVLNASCGILSGEKHRLSDEDFENFYFKAMGIALKGFV
jgi:hypothetical protein